MSEQKINPNQVTKPIQLLAAWLVGLILINGSFLGAARAISNPDWAPGLLVIAAVLNVPIFLILIFFLQTKFRAELQEDTFYSKHLEKVTGTTKEKPTQSESFLNQLKKLEKKNDHKVEELAKNIESISVSLEQNNKSNDNLENVLSKLNETRNTLTKFEAQKIKSTTKIAINDLLPSYKEIAKKLVLSGYSISDTFGSTSEKKEFPRSLTISYTSNLPKSSLKEIYELTKDYGFNRIDYDYDDLEEANIFIGSYIDDYPEARTSVLINEELEAAIKDDSISIDELGEIILEYRA
ncbi:MAG: hypothetical protein ABJE79_10720 [Marinomonas sp.]